MFDPRIFYKQAKTLVEAGYKVTIISQHNKSETVDGINIIALPKPTSRFLRMLSTMKVFVLALKNKADIYHFHDPELIPTGILLKLVTGSKVIYDVHEDYPKAVLTKNWLPSAARKTISLLFESIEKLASLFFNRVITATKSIAKHFKKSIATIVGNYPILKHIRAKQEYNNGNPVLIYIGGLNSANGIGEIVQSMKLINAKYNAKLLLVGRFSDKDYESNILSAISELSNIEYMGQQPQITVFNILQKASIGFTICPPQPNSIDAEPNKMFEYMATGLPVIVSNFPLWKEIVEDNKCGITVNPLDPQEIARAVEYLCSNPELMEKMGRNGRKTVMGKYNWGNESKILLSVYSSL